VIATTVYISFQVK